MISEKIVSYLYLLLIELREKNRTFMSFNEYNKLTAADRISDEVAANRCK